MARAQSGLELAGTYIEDTFRRLGEDSTRRRWRQKGAPQPRASLVQCTAVMTSTCRGQQGSSSPGAVHSSPLLSSAPAWRGMWNGWARCRSRGVARGGAAGEGQTREGQLRGRRRRVGLGNSQVTLVHASPPPGPGDLVGSSSWRDAMTPEHEKQLEALFRRMDTNGDGVLSFREAEQFAESVGMPRILWQDTLDNVGGRHGWLFPHRGIMNLEEFKEGMVEKEHLMQIAFQNMDKNGDGKIEMQELEQGLRALEIKGNKYMPRRRITDAGVLKIMRFVDHGRPLDYDHFRDLFVMVPLSEIKNVTPYYMKVAMDLGHEFEIPDRQRGGMPWGHVVAGGLAGVVSKTVTSPINVLLCLLQAGRGSGRSVPALAAMLLKQEGPKAFYRGNLANVMRSAPSKAVDFSAYNFLKQLFTRNVGLPSDAQRVLAGGMAGLCSTVLFYPLEVVTARLAVATPGLYKGMGDCLGKMLRTEGVQALYAGLGPAMMGVIPYAGINFASYDLFKEAWKAMDKEKKDNFGLLPTMVCGMAAGWAGMTAAYPFDVVGMRMQCQGMDGGPLLYRGMLDCVVKLWGQEGLPAFYRGWALASLKVIPSAAASYTTYEAAKKGLGLFLDSLVEVEVPKETAAEERARMARKR